MLAANSISNHRRPVVDYQNPRAAADALRDTRLIDMYDLPRNSTHYRNDPAYYFDAYGNSIFGSYLNDNLGTSS
jgi:hypothetical protein